jgi:hypothetical protein
MHRRLILSITLAIGLLACRTGSAQEKGKAGVTLGYPASIGVIWHVTDRVAIRPELSLSFGTSEVTTTSASVLPGVGGTGVRTNTDSTAVGVGVSGLYYLSKAASLSSYVSPRFLYTHNRITSESSTDLLGASFLNGSSYALSGSYGVHYTPITRIALFAEAGIGFTDSSSSSSLSEQNGHQVSTRGGIGVILYF